MAPTLLSFSSLELVNRIATEAIPIIPGYRPFQLIADHLTRQGIAVLRYDDRGVGQSTGDPSTATSADFAQDAEAGLTYLLSRPGSTPADRAAGSQRGST